MLPKYDDPVICTYDLSQFAATVAMDILRTHPVVIVGGVLQENPFFVPPDQFLLEIRQQRPGSRERNDGRPNLTRGNFMGTNGAAVQFLAEMRERGPVHQQAPIAT